MGFRNTDGPVACGAAVQAWKAPDRQALAGARAGRAGCPPCPWGDPQLLPFHRPIGHATGPLGLVFVALLAPLPSAARVLQPHDDELDAAFEQAPRERQQRVSRRRARLRILEDRPFGGLCWRRGPRDARRSAPPTSSLWSLVVSFDPWQVQPSGWREARPFRHRVRLARPRLNSRAGTRSPLPDATCWMRYSPFALRVPGCAA